MHSAPNERTSPDARRERLRHVHWIGGGSGSGKSTIAQHIADRYGMRLYDTDAVMPDHARRMSVEQAPHLARFAAMDMDERWVARSPREMLDTFHWFHGEGFDLIIEDLLALPADRPVIAEGFRLLPGLVRPLLADVSHAVWLLPTPRFRQAVFDSRGGPAWGFLAKTSAPRQALRNLLQRDALFTDRLTEQTRHLGLHGLRVDSTTTEEDLVRQVSALFGLEDP
ncbi:Shikimate kinase [Thermomonospora echinospora]|uniref:Shikimate kinase n=1 Tax=Thermomonospora echinospora TaxID=1992 RepID=A0A1H6AXH0_9ACTN|nr:shikimate kinase [Thermomonospora echinospora]SEG53054.1 Shikimate kinase [Thermomonospora echinospora]